MYQVITKNRWLYQKIRRSNDLNYQDFTNSLVFVFASPYFAIVGSDCTDNLFRSLQSNSEKSVEDPNPVKYVENV